MALKSPTSTHSFWGSYATTLPTPSTVEVGDTAFLIADQQMYVCVSVGPVVWSALSLTQATRIIHTPGVTPTNATFVPGLAPEVTLFGTLVTLHYKKDTDKVYGYAKIPTSYVSDASFHIHWTKNTDVALNGTNNAIRWVINYTVFNGASQDVNVAPTGTLTLDDTYDDVGTTTRVVYRTSNASATGFVAGYYVSFEVGFDPAFTTLPNRPAIVSCDMLSRQTINAGN